MLSVAWHLPHTIPFLSSEKCIIDMHPFLMFIFASLYIYSYNWWKYIDSSKTKGGHLESFREEDIVLSRAGWHMEAAITSWDLALLFEMWLIISKQWTPLPSQSSSHSLNLRIPWTLFLFFGSPNLSPELNFADYFFILFPWLPRQSSFTCHPKAPLGLPTTFPHHQVPSRFFSNFPCLLSPLFRPFQ